MASTDARPVPKKNTAYRVYFPIMKSDGTVITSWAGAAAQISKDGAQAATANGTPTEILAPVSGNWGIGYLDVLQTEMNADATIIKVTVTNTGAITTILVLYNEEGGDIRVNVTYVNDQGIATSGIPSGYMPSVVKVGTGTGELDLVSGRVKQVAVLSGTASAGTSTSITLAGGIATDNIYKYSRVTITGGTGIGQTRTILDYVGSTKVATVNKPWATNPDNTSTFDILPDSELHTIHSGIAQAGATSTITLSAGASTDNADFVGALIFLSAGTGIGQIRVISSYVGSTKVATVSQAWGTNPDNTTVYEILAIGRSQADNLVSLAADQAVNVTKVGGTSQTARDLGANIDVATSTRLAASDYTTPPTVVQNRQEMDSNSTKLANLDTTLSSRLPTSGYTVPPTVVQNRQEMDSNSTKLANLDAAVSTRSTYAGADSPGTGTLLTRLTAARAGYLDNLNVGGNVASSAEVTIIQNNTRVVRVVPENFERPDSGSTAFRVELLIYDETGNMEAPDSAPTLGVVNQAGTSRDANLDSTTMTLVSTGRYRSTYTIDTAHAIEQLIFAFTVVEGGATRIYANAAFVVDTTAVDFTSADRTKLDAVYGKLPSKSYITGTANSDGDIQADEITGPLTVTVNLDKTGYGLADDAITAAKIAPDAIGSSELAASAISEIQSGLATSTQLTALQTHGDSTWATGSLPTLTELQDALNAVQAHGDTDWSTADISALLTTAHLDSQIAALETYGNLHWTTANVAALLTAAAFNTAITNLQTHGDTTWPTANLTGLSTVTQAQVRTQADAALAALRLNELLSHALSGDPVTDSVFDTLLGRSDLWAVDLEGNGYSGSEAGALLLEIFQRSLMISEDGVNFVGIVNPTLQEFAIVQGTSYTTTSGAILPEWTSTDWTAVDLTTATVKFRAYLTGSPTAIFEKAVDVVNATTIRLQLTATETGAFTYDKSKPYHFQIIATLSNGEKYPLVPVGKMLVVAKI